MRPLLMVGRGDFMPRLPGELIFAPHLSFEVWPNCRARTPHDLRTASTYIFSARLPEIGQGCRLDRARPQYQGNKSATGPVSITPRQSASGASGESHSRTDGGGKIQSRDRPRGTYSTA